MIKTISFFRKDALDRVLLRIFGRHLAKSFPTLLLATILLFWLPVYLLDIYGRFVGQMPSLRFHHDYAATTYLFAIPLLLRARSIFDFEWNEVQRTIYGSKLLSDDAECWFIKHIVHLNNSLRSKTFFIALFFISYMITAILFVSTVQQGAQTWFVYHIGNTARISIAGWYHWLVGVPAYLFVLFYWIGKYFGWVRFLYLFARSNPRIVGHHPDRTGGLGFLSDATLGLSVLIFCIGVVEATTILYKIEVEGILIQSLPVLVIVMLYMVIAPTLFFCPLLFFTKRLYIARKESIRLLNRIGYQFHSKASRVFVNDPDIQSIIGFCSQADLASAAQNVAAMRITPIDLMSVTRFLLSTLVPLLPLLISLLDMPAPLRSFFKCFGF